ncbi:FlgO family outer membrane protein [Aliiglaciecola sp. 3_MG-2023]|uniref:FlgO family outer membrane protein n=1 Tax=Aliiglaciecola sp. 3_MG-2023 TaxID=3062644 RepID=UPI0026E3F13D|nr:FlgO family outer membrane protein [Aliiglaciecola sp. 3_MG-2023]MDO6695331.1 FlgO family outer membrane protein [Aliiglaciecola sp. 3_MG-2023]
MLNKQKLQSCIWTVLALCLSACSSMSETENQPKMQYEESLPALGNIEYHTSILANELFAGLTANRDYRYAVVNFVPVTNLQFDKTYQHPLMLLGHQLSEGMVTEASRRGFITQDYKITNDILVTKEAEYALSRDVSRLAPLQNVDFYIAGTITEQQEGAIVNARIIHVESKDVVASATKFFPAELFWLREKVTMRGGMIYRTGS